MTLSEIMDVVREEDFDVTFSGGDPLYRPEEIARLADAIRAEGHSVWLYTGFTWEEIIADERLMNAVRRMEAVVEGRFVESLRDPDLQFRGSSNQRIIMTASEIRMNRIKFIR